MAANLARRARHARWLERHRHRIAVIVGVLGAAMLWFELPCWMGPDWPVIHARFTALLAGKLLQIAVELVLIVTTTWWEVQLGRAAREGVLPQAIVVDRSKL